MGAYRFPKTTFDGDSRMTEVLYRTRASWRVQINKCCRARSIKPSEGSRSRLRRTRWGYGNCMWAKEGLGRRGVVSESKDRAVGRGCGTVALMMRSVQLRMFR